MQSLRGWLAALLAMGLCGTGSLEAAKKRPRPAVVLRQAYVEALRGYSAGHLQDALAHLSRAQAAVTSKRRGRTLRDIEREITARLADHRPRAVFAVAALYAAHHDKYQLGRSQWARDTRRRIFELLELYLESADTAADHRRAAALVTSLATDLLDSSQASLAVKVLEQALIFDPRSPAALHLQASLLEKFDRLGAAEVLLERLVVGDAPENHSARLRLALVRGRLGKVREAHAELESLAARSKPPWVTVVALQELARLLASTGRRAEAVARLLQGIERFPGQSRLRLQLAFLRSLESATADTDLQSLHGLQSWADGSTPRSRYNQWPSAELDRQKAYLEGEVKASQGALAQALAELEAAP